MSITVIRDVFCDWPECLQWVHGTVHSGNKEARKQAKAAGWGRAKVDGVMMDLCPAHLKMHKQG